MTSYHRKVLSGRQTWTRPTTRMYSYNFQVAENYYSPMTNYLNERNATLNGYLPTPGPLDFNERMHNRFSSYRSPDYVNVETSFAPSQDVRNAFERAKTAFL